MMDAGLYIHIPFCEKKCDYCDFYSITQIDQMDKFVQALTKEIEIRAQNFSDYIFQTIYFGGGTPSLLNEKQLQQIWNSLTSNFTFVESPEVSIESNPGTLTKTKFSFLKEIGFNRLSLGVQSFNPDELIFLGRIHSPKEVYQSFEYARNAGFKNINLDLMTAFPGITINSFQKSLNEALRLKPEHISCYTLIFEPGTIFYKKKQQNDLIPFEDDEEASYYQVAREILKTNGYLHYEISNFSLGENFICRHNQIYWKHKTYLGLGPSAHSFYHNQRQANKRSLSFYMNELEKGILPVDFTETLTEEDKMLEYIFLNFRLHEGINLNEFRNLFGQDYIEKFGSKIKYLSENNLIEMDANYVRLSDRGWMLADSVAAYF